MSKTPIIHLYGGPGTGKSTTAALVFGALKQRGHNVELVTEYAKDLTWEQSYGKLGFQPYVIAKQMWRLRRLTDQVDAIVTDTSILLGLIYGTVENGVTQPFREWLVDEYNHTAHYDIFLTRDPTRAYNPKGRNQTEAQAQDADNQIKELLDSLGKSYCTLQVDKTGNTHVDQIVDLVESAYLGQPA